MEHPDTLVMTNDVGSGFFDFRQKFNPNFVIGLLLGGEAKAYYYRDVEAAGIINDLFSDVPVFIWAESENFHAYIRQVGDQVLTFELKGSRIVDQETGSTWNIGRGLAVSGPLKGQGLQGVPSSSSFDWAWLDFYPQSALYDHQS